MSEDQNSNGLTRMQKIEIAFVIMCVLFLGILCGFAWVVLDVRGISQDSKTLVESNRDLARKADRLSRENDQRIKDIQKNRLESCKETYAAFRQVFRPFTPPLPRTKQQLDDLEKFNTIISNLQKTCSKLINRKENNAG